LELRVYFSNKIPCNNIPEAYTQVREPQVTE
jgi:hypothetical protein